MTMIQLFGTTIADVSQSQLTFFFFNGSFKRLRYSESMIFNEEKMV